MSNLLKEIGFSSKDIVDPQEAIVSLQGGNHTIVRPNAENNNSCTLHIFQDKTVAVFEKSKFEDSETREFFFLFNKGVKNIVNLSQNDLQSILDKKDISEAVVLNNRKSGFHNNRINEYNYSTGSNKAENLMNLIVNKIGSKTLNLEETIPQRVSKLKI